MNLKKSTKDVEDKMDNSLKIIDIFMQNFSSEVEARSAAKLPPDLCERLKKLHAGQLEADDRRELSRELLSNPKAMEFLVNEINGRA